MSSTSRRIVIAGLGAWAASASAVAAQDDDPRLASTGADRARRLTVDVRIGGRGPFAFTIDTAAARTVVSDRIVAALGLEPIGEILLHTLAGAETVPSVLLPDLTVAKLAPVRLVAAVARHEGLGADGLLGLDVLQGRRVDLEVRTGRLAIRRARIDQPSFFDATPRSVVRFDLIEKPGLGSVIAAPVRTGNVVATALLDTGAQTTIVNSAFVRAVGPRFARPIPETPKATVTTATGQVLTADTAKIGYLRLGDVRVRDLGVLIGDFHTFRLLGLGDTPAVLLAVDILRSFSLVSIDLKRRELVFRE